MNREDLAEEIRGAGFALRYADGPVIGGSFTSKKPFRKQIKNRKLKESDWMIIQRASTCFTCGERASDSDINEAIDMATSYKDFARQIWMSCEHDEDCDHYEADPPYMSVSDEAKEKFAKARKKFTRKVEKKKVKEVSKKKTTKPAKKKPRRGKK